MGDAALAMGRTIAAKSPVAVVSTKHLMNRKSAAESDDPQLMPQMREITR